MDPHNGPLFQSSLLEAGGGSMRGVSVGSGTWFCMLQDLECKTDLHSKTSGQERRILLPGN